MLRDRPVDSMVQSTVIIASSPIVRAVCSWILKVCKPPRPVRICKDDAAAVAATRALEPLAASPSGRVGKLAMSATPDDAALDGDIELDDVSNRIEAMDVAAESELAGGTRAAYDRRV
jgi:hypothetical protein